MLATLRGHGALGALVSGSGPTCFGLFEDRAAAEAVARQARRRARRRPAPRVPLESSRVRRADRRRRSRRADRRRRDLAPPRAQRRAQAARRRGGGRTRGLRERRPVGAARPQEADRRHRGDARRLDLRARGGDGVPRDRRVRGAGGSRRDGRDRRRSDRRRGDDRADPADRPGLGLRRARRHHQLLHRPPAWPPLPRAARAQGQDHPRAAGAGRGVLRPPRRQDDPDRALHRPRASARARSSRAPRG